MRVLFVEDVPADAELNEREVRKVLPLAEFRRVETRDAFLAALASFRPDVILSDYQLPEFDGMSALLLARERAPEIPFILVTGSMNEETAVACMKAGAWDYILKDHLRRLGPAVLMAREQKRLRDEHRRAGESLRESEARYRSIFENNHAVMLLIDPDTGWIVDANPAAAAYYGWSREQLCQKKIGEINTLPPSELQAEIERARRAQRNHFHFRHRLADGTIRDVEVFSGTIAMAGLSLLFSIVHDVSERRKAETGLRLSQFCIDHAAIGIFRIDENGSILEANEQACASLGYSCQELCALSVFDIDPTFSRERWREHRQQVQTVGSGSLETQHRRKDGSIFPVEVTVNYFEYEGQALSFSFVRDITERKQAEDRLRHQATHDELTGLANRTLLHDRLEQSIHYANRSQRLVAVLLLDLDRFKIINDSLGHGIGDELLRSAARRLTETVREADTVARMGGDEFVVLLAEVAEAEDVGLVAKKILEKLTLPYPLGGREITVTASLGVSLYPRDGADGATLLRNADVAMYRAKEEGDTFHFYAPAMNQRVHETLELETDLRRALERGEFLLHYQPKVALATGRITGAEALLRWQHPQRGLIAPGMFIPLAEETGLILPIGEWVLATACAQVRAWLDAGLPAVPVAVNLSARQFGKAGLPDLVDQALRQSGIAPCLLELELTESMIMRDPLAAAATMQELKALGVHLALDDFGTGYSSLNYLRRFPVDSLKIDRSFISDVASDASAAAVATSIVAIANSLGLQVVAEGVETREQLAFLRNCGCDSLQGYYFSRPVPTEEFAVLVGEGRRLE
jgi:diguanylate cyclase (GGDEF)-like protein/PAS domain S-box-containing protein